MKDVEGRLRALGETKEAETGLAPTPGSLRRIRLYRAIVSGIAVACVVALGSGAYFASDFLRNDNRVVSPAENEEPVEPPQQQPDFGAIWPEDTAGQAQSACEERSGIESWVEDSTRTAREFGRIVLEWDDPLAIVQDENAKRSSVELRMIAADDGEEAWGPAVIVYMTEAFGCWFVGSVSRPPDDNPTGVGVDVAGRDVRIAFHTLGAYSATAEVGYAGRLITKTWEKGSGQPVTMRLDFDPDTTGHFLVLMRDSKGGIFSATGGPLPKGDFTAG